MSLNRILPTIAVAALVSTVATACVSKTALAPEQEDYAGRWVAADGTYVQIFLDGTGNVKGANTTIEGGAATITDQQLVIALGPIKQEFKITEKPTEVDGVWTLKLNGISYKKES